MIQVSHQCDMGSFSTSIPVELKTLKFPGGEVGIKIPLQSTTKTADEFFIVKAWLNNSDAVMELLMVFDAIRRQRANPRIFLVIGYLPYARQDRVCDSGESLSIAVMAKLINSLNAEGVAIYDPHSNVALPLIDRCVENKQDSIFKAITISDEHPFPKGFKGEDWLLVAPDAGARKKTEALAKVIGAKGVVYADKERDLATGKILRTTVNYDGCLDDSKLFIVDDICDGGRTFIELAKALKEKWNIDELGLFVTHGIFSKGFDELNQYFDHIHTTNTYHANSIGNILPDGTEDTTGKFFSFKVM